MNQQENISLQIFLEHSVNNPGNLIKRSQITVFVTKLNVRKLLFLSISYTENLQCLTIGNFAERNFQICESLPW